MTGELPVEQVVQKPEVGVNGISSEAEQYPNEKIKRQNFESQEPEQNTKPSLLSSGIGNDNDDTIKDSKEMLGIFPEEIWMLILENIQDPILLERVSNSSPFFRHLLHPKRVLFLFPKVWNILGIKYLQSREQLISDARDNYLNRVQEVIMTGDDRPSITARLEQLEDEKWMSIMLKYRQICKTWCQSIDEFYEERDPYIFKFENNNDLDQSFYWLLETSFATEFQSPNNPRPFRHQKFLQKFETSHGSSEPTRNPFLGRRCSIKFNAQNENFLNEIITLLYKYGKHIWYLKIEIKHLFESSLVWYSLLREWLGFVPNLRSLHIIYDGQNLPLPEIPDLNQEIALNPLPKFDDLHSLRTEYLFTPIVNELLRKNSHISGLEIKRRSSQQRYGLYTISLPNLKQLELDLYFEADFRKLQNSEMKWSLEKLYLGMGKMPFIQWPEIFKMLEDKWAWTLTDLEIYFPNVNETQPDRVMREEWGLGDGDERIMEGSTSFRLNLPKLKRLKLGLARNVCCLDFILPVKDNLEILEVERAACLGDRRSVRYLAEKKGQVIEYVGWTCRILESNIWEICSKLKQIIFFRMTKGERFERLYPYSREEWEAQNRDKLNGLKEK